MVLPEPFPERMPLLLQFEPILPAEPMDGLRSGMAVDSDFAMKPQQSLPDRFKLGLAATQFVKIRAISDTSN